MTWQELLQRTGKREGKVKPGNPSTAKFEPVEPPGFGPEGHLVESNQPKTLPEDEVVKMKNQVMG